MCYVYLARNPASKCVQIYRVLALNSYCYSAVLCWFVLARKLCASVNIVAVYIQTQTELSILEINKTAISRVYFLHQVIVCTNAVS